jgi:pilus assembly protein CpaF
MSLLMERAGRNGAGPEPEATTRPTPPHAPTAAADQFMGLKMRVHERLISELDVQRLAGQDEDAVRGQVEEACRPLLIAEDVPLSRPERQRLIDEIADEVLGLGPIQPLLDDPAVSEVMVNGPNRVYYEREGILHPSTRRFKDAEHLMRVIDKIVTPLNRRVDEKSPMVDARLPDGSRVNAIIPPLALDGPILTIRKFARDPFQIAELIRLHTLTPEIAQVLRACVYMRLNLVVCGGTGTGKTTLLNVLSSFIPIEERIVTIEDPAELQLRQEHVIRLETRPSNIEGEGQVTQRDLVRNALRMRPDRIVVGEVRGGEAFDMLQAMNTGHDGSLTTVHANSPRDALSRIENMVMMAGLDIPAKAVREQVASAIQVIVQLTRMRDGSRRITQVSELVGMEGPTVTLQDIFVFHARGLDDAGRLRGEILPTGIRPRFADRFGEYGVELPAQLFDKKADR